MNNRDPRVLPHHLEAEASVLGGVILRNEALALLPDLETEDFYDLRHRVVFQALRKLESELRPMDVVTIEAEIEKTGKLDAIGGIAFLGELALRVPTVDNIEHYAKIVRDHSITRSVMLMLSQMLEEARTGLSEGEQLIHDVSSALNTIRVANHNPVVSLAELVSAEEKNVERDVADRLNGKLVYAGVPSGVYMIDEKIGGHPLGLLTLYIGRPGAGKSTVAMMFGRASRELGQSDTLIASYEDSGQTFGQRGLAQESGIPTGAIRSRRLDQEQLVAIHRSRGRYQQRTESFLSASGMSVDSLARRVRRENIARVATGRPPLRQLVVDYIQKIPMPEWARSRDDGISYISRVLCNVAVSENMAVVALCQLNREVEKRDDHRPRLSDIRDSGSLEQDGKLIVGLYYPHGYEADKYPEEELHLIVLKNHQGETDGDIKMFWDRKTHAIFNSQIEWMGNRRRTS